MAGRKKSKAGDRFRVRNLGVVSDAKLRLTDLTVLVGPQAGGKSVFLQTLKLAADRDQIVGFFKRQNAAFNGDPKSFLDGYYGRGMAGMLEGGPTISWKKGEWRGLEDLAKSGAPKSSPKERLFYIPAQRVNSLSSGASRTFETFNFGDPYVLRYFAHQLHVLLQNDFGTTPRVFPSDDHMNDTLRGPITEHIFGGARLFYEPSDFTMRLTLRADGLSEALPFNAWSTGQREFAPLLLGLYWLCPPGDRARRGSIERVVIEEPELGLHPRAVSAFLLTVLDLMERGYKVIISTHSVAVMDFVWALGSIQECGGTEADVRGIFKLPSNEAASGIARSALSKKCSVYFFDRNKPVQDISSLDPGSEDEAVSLWGDLNGFARLSTSAVVDVVSREERRRDASA